MSDEQKDQVVKIGAIVACIPPLILLYGMIVTAIALVAALVIKY